MNSPPTGGTALGWTLYAWGGGPDPGHRRYYDVVELLVGADATYEDEWLAESERGFPLAKRIREDARMSAALAKRR